MPIREPVSNAVGHAGATAGLADGSTLMRRVLVQVVAGLVFISLPLPSCSSGGHHAGPPPSTAVTPPTPTAIANTAEQTQPARDDAITMTLPNVAPGDAQATRDYLSSNGTLLQTFRAAITPLISLTAGTDATTPLNVCTSVATALNTVGPGELLTSAQQVPDPVLAELFIDERRLVSDSLVACGANNSTTIASSLSALHNADILIGRRMNELGI